MELNTRRKFDKMCVFWPSSSVFSTSFRVCVRYLLCLVCLLLRRLSPFRWICVTKCVLVFAPTAVVLFCHFAPPKFFFLSLSLLLSQNILSHNIIIIIANSIHFRLSIFIDGKPEWKMYSKVNCNLLRFIFYSLQAVDFFIFFSTCAFFISPILL